MEHEQRNCEKMNSMIMNKNQDMYISTNQIVV